MMAIVLFTLGGIGLLAVGAFLSMLLIEIYVK